MMNGKTGNMKTNILLLGVMPFLLAACYEDKGNYDYKEVNDVLSLTFSPEPVVSEYSYDYKYRQPALDTLYVTYTPQVEQSQQEGGVNLEFQWIQSRIVNQKTVYDTVKAKELTLKYPPKKASSYSPLFRMIDHSTGIEYYRQFTMKTEVPFIMSWFVLHGQPGDRKIGVVEGIDDPAKTAIAFDAYEEIWGIRRFQNAIGFVYASSDGDIYTDYEHITVLQPDSCAYMHPFNLLVTKRYEQMFPVLASRPRFVYGVGDETASSTLIVDERGQCYWAKSFGYYFMVNTNEETKDYVADKVFISEGGYATIWDKEHKRFYYYQLRSNGTMWSDPGIHPEDEGFNNAVLTLFDEGVFAEGELENQEVLYLGQGNNSLSERGVMVLAADADKHYTVYQIGYNVKGSSSVISMEKVPLPGLSLDENSVIATSVAYADQFFFTRSSGVYLYNMMSGEEIMLYDAGGEIAQLEFRIARNYDPGYGAVNANNRLGIVVNNPDGTGELHEIFLDGAGDVQRNVIYTGFGPIQDIVFSAQGKMRY